MPKIRYRYDEKIDLINSGEYSELNKLYYLLWNAGDNAFSWQPLYKKKLFLSIKKSHSRKVCRLKEFINSISFYGPLYFCTFTLKHESYNDEYIRKQLRKHLNKFGLPYCFNPDYGSENGRLHFHAVTSFLPSPWSFGFCKFEKVSNGPHDRLKVSRYMGKLANHSAKFTTGFSRVYYKYPCFPPPFLLE